MLNLLIDTVDEDKVHQGPWASSERQNVYRLLRRDQHYEKVPHKVSCEGQARQSPMRELKTKIMSCFRPVFFMGARMLLGPTSGTLHSFL